jgi:hypothetical protein
MFHRHANMFHRLATMFHRLATMFHHPAIMFYCPAIRMNAREVLPRENLLSLPRCFTSVLRKN